MTQYSITGKQDKTITLSYTDAGVLFAFTAGWQVDGIEIDWLLQNLPRNEAFLVAHCQTRKWKLIQIAEDLTFERFWVVYDYKVGKRVRAIRLWDAMNDAEKSQVFKHIPKYQYYLATHQGIEKLYPETYLSQRRFENEFK